MGAGPSGIGEGSAVGGLDEGVAGEGATGDGSTLPVSGDDTTGEGAGSPTTDAGWDSAMLAACVWSGVVADGEHASPNIVKAARLMNTKAARIEGRVEGYESW